MATQIQGRGASQATQESRTLAAREHDINTTDYRHCIHDGATPGGVPHVNYADAQNREFTYAAASGTNSIAITLAKAPAAYQAGQAFSFKAANTITGSATLNVNALGAKTIKKVSGGSIVTLTAGDIIAGMIYEVSYDGTDMLLKGGNGGVASPIASASPTGGSTVDFNDVFEAGYDYEIVLDKVQPATDAVKLYIRLAAVGGSFLSGTGDYEYIARVLGGTAPTAYNEGAVATFINVCGTSEIGNASSESISGKIFITNPMDATRVTNIGWHLWFEDSANSQIVSDGAANFRNNTGSFAANATDSIRFLWSSGNFGAAGGSIKIYKIPRS